ncbi:LysR family transcriptional regulator [Affinibrenneria salicis]|uniref:LysR family transcriptional regulator n=1 Tax=Affinibrenneria salicis TaxID=2590031 RepID=A0A5J5G195_9GAMM|nr:LysR family transcriptional regulator [Affinibrenneria salicis]KAA9000445.1 LysR family transcriptional regulator [Affinibrenneria salicis]
MSIIQDHRIRYFYEAVKRGSVRAAADFLNVAPSAVSRHISQLESELTTALIERHRRGVRPTEAGEEVLTYYRSHLAQQELLMDTLQSLKGLQSGTVSIAIGEGYIDDVSAILCRFSAKYPAIKITLSVCGSNELLRRVGEDEAHIGVVFHPGRGPKIRTHSGAVHPMCAVVNMQHPLCEADAPLELNKLNEFRLALPDVSHGVRQIIAEAEDDSGVTLTPALVCNNLSTLKPYALHGGVTLLPAFMVQEELTQNRLRAIPLYNSVFSSTRTHVVTRLGRQLSVGAGQLLQMMVQEMRSLKSL